MKSAAIRIHALSALPGRGESESGRSRHWLDGCLCVRGTVPAEVEKLVVMDGVPPGSGRLGGGVQQPSDLALSFNGATPGSTGAKGRERTYFEHFWNNFAADKTRSIPEADRKAYAEAYARPGRMRAAGRILFHSNRRRRTSRNSLKPN